MPNNFRVKINVNDVKKLIKSAKTEVLKYDGVRTGYIRGKDYNGKDFDTVENALLQEFGSKNGKIPSRPFIRNTIEKNAEKWTKDFEKLLNKEEPLKMMLSRMGVIVKTDLQDSIDSNTPPPNAKSTVKAKGSSYTLIDTGKLRNSIQMELIKNK
ncbi:MAG: hypothetical protein LBG48_01705 [Rickettsiales bacterium]|jgi:hypothetical protein|nr:hypothetical protein [Rickettsiales bacterium]